jgi:CheY-like chemotaxis protein
VTSRILVVDDLDDTTETMCMLFEVQGHTCFRAANGQEALDIAAREAPHIVFMDLSMPIMDGLTAAGRMRQLPIEQPRLIALSSAANASAPAQARLAGFDSYIAKPVDTTLLFALIDELTPTGV